MKKNERMVIQGLIYYLAKQDGSELALPHPIESADDSIVNQFDLDTWEDIRGQINVTTTADALDTLHDHIIDDDDFEPIYLDAAQALYVIKKSQSDPLSHQLYWDLDEATDDDTAQPLTNQDLLDRLHSYVDQDRVEN